MSSKFIQDYSFGRIVIEGRTYTDDVILLGKKVFPGWWRNKGHDMVIQDIKEIIEFDPDILIIGTGSSGGLRVPREVIKNVDFELKGYTTQKACKKYNELIKKSSKVAAGLHLTC